MRIATANTYQTIVDNLNARQADLVALQTKVSSGQNVNQASDNPVAAAQIERSLTRIGQLQAQQRALTAQKDAINTAQSTLGSGVTALQSFRQLMIQASDVTLNPSDRSTIAQQLSGLRDQLFALANTKDSNGTYLFSGLENAAQQGAGAAPFSSTGSGATTSYSFNGLPGQNLPTQNSIPYTMDGSSIFMNVDKGNGTFGVQLGSNKGQISTDAGSYSGASPMTDAYSITFSGPPGGITYDVTDTTTGTSVLTGQTYTSGQAITFAGVSVQVSGTPQANDSLTITPYDATPANGPKTNVFAALDAVINGITGASSSSPNLTQTIQNGLRQVDSALNSLTSAQGLAGQWLNRADTVSTAQASLSTQLQSDLSASQDTDLVQTISDFQSAQTGYQAALQSYAQVQKLSLFNYLN